MQPQMFRSICVSLLLVLSACAEPENKTEGGPPPRRPDGITTQLASAVRSELVRLQEQEVGEQATPGFYALMREYKAREGVRNKDGREIMLAHYALTTLQCHFELMEDYGPLEQSDSLAIKVNETFGTEYRSGEEAVAGLRERFSQFQEYDGLNSMQLTFEEKDQLHADWRSELSAHEPSTQYFADVCDN
jgi:hypothetical protein